MGIAVPAANPAWWDVLRLGRESPYARFFDIDWDRAPIMVPVLADAGAVADLTIIDGQLAYHDLRFPIAPGTGGGTPQQVHERQYYRLADWRRANSELNYRRFFDVTTLAAVRVEDPEVFEATHATVLGWVAAGQVTGLRVDHPDGLADPGAYLRRLAAEAPSAWLVVEKILGPDEALPARWPVDGTTGYDALRLVCGLFVDGAGELALTAFADEECGDQDLREMDYTAKWWVAEDILRAEVRRIARVVGRVVPAQQIEPGQAEQVVIELLACFPVYRSYLADGEADALQAAAAEATRWSPELAGPIEALVRQMTGDRDGELAERVQQTAAMVMAKGEEDTVFYRYNRFIALNEVGGDPGRFGVPPEEFHHRARRAAAGDHARSMTTLSTHDTKRSEDVRARLAVLSEVPGEFTDAVRRWSARAGLPEPALNLLAWQSLVGAWPITPERLAGYLEKAAREAKIETSWIEPNPEFDAAVAAWPKTVLADAELAADVAGFVALVRPARLGKLAGPEARSAHHARRARPLPGQRTVGPVAGRPGQPPSGRLHPAPGTAGAHRRWLAARRGRVRRGQAAGGDPGPAAAPGPARPFRRLPPAVGRRPGRRSRRRVRAGRRPPGRRGHPPPADPAAHRRLARDLPAPAGRPGGLDGRSYRPTGPGRDRLAGSPAQPLSRCPPGRR